MEWFDSELPLRNSHLLEVKNSQAMAELIEVQQEEESFGLESWLGFLTWNLGLGS